MNTQFFGYTKLNNQTVLFQTIQFNVRTRFSFIWPIDRTLSGATTPYGTLVGGESYSSADG